MWSLCRVTLSVSYHFRPLSHDKVVSMEVCWRFFPAPSWYVIPCSRIQLQINWLFFAIDTMSTGAIWGSWNIWRCSVFYLRESGKSVENHGQGDVAQIQFNNDLILGEEIQEIRSDICLMGRASQLLVVNILIVDQGSRKLDVGLLKMVCKRYPSRKSFWWL